MKNKIAKHNQVKCMMLQSIQLNFMEVSKYFLFKHSKGADLGYYYINIYVGTPP